MLMSLKCKLGLHKYEKFMGPESVGSKFYQRYKCAECGNIKRKNV